MSLLLHPRSRLAALAAAAWLGACANTPPQANVQVYTGAPQLAAGTTYRYERLPSQAGQPAQAQLEAAADAALARAELRRDDAAPKLSLQVTSRQDLAPAARYGWGGPSIGIGIGGGGGGGSVGIGFGIPIGGGGGTRATQLVDVQLRDLGTGRIVFQSQATSGASVSPVALLQAALSDFPNSPAGPRQVPLAAAPLR